jgi:hypothetical protein
MDRRSEREALDRLAGAVQAGESRALVVRGEPGVGKTVLLDYLAGQASGSGCRVARVTGVQSEMELAFAGLHQLCVPTLGRDRYARDRGDLGALGGCGPEQRPRALRGGTIGGPASHLEPL